MDEYLVSAVKLDQSKHGYYVLMTYRQEGMSLHNVSSLKRIVKTGSKLKTQMALGLNTTINDFTVTDQGTLWAVDVLGHLHCSKPLLPSSFVDKRLEWENDTPQWQHQWCTWNLPSCVEGEDDDLWIATHEQSLIHFNGQTFTEEEHYLVGPPIRMRKFAPGHIVLTTFDGGCYQYQQGQWTRLLLAEDVPQNIAINDVALVNDVLFAVSVTGHILRYTSKGVFETVIHEKGKSWYGCIEFNGQLHLAGAKDGAFCFDETGLKQLKVYDHILGVHKGINCLFFILGINQEGSYVRYTPTDEKAWKKMF